MHIIECHFEFSGFDDHLVKAGTSVYLWNLIRQFHAIGHRVIAVTPAHGLLPYLRKHHEVTDMAWRFTDEVPVRLDPSIWTNFPEEITLHISARAHRIVVEGVEILLLSGELLDMFSDSFYPPATLEGVDLAFLKPLAFQIAASRFLTENFPAGSIVHLHEPMHHYLIPAAIAAHGFIVASTVQTNMPVNRKVYASEVRSVLAHLGADTSSLNGLADPPLDSFLQRAMRVYLPRTGLYFDSPERTGHEYVSMLALIVRSVSAMDFLSEGQMEHALTQAGTPFEALFRQLAVCRELGFHADRLVVGGCAIGDEWMNVSRTPKRRERTLSTLGLDTALPTIFHNSRYSVQHKGQRELFRAVRRLLDEGERCNVLLHCLAPGTLHDPDLNALAVQYPLLVRVHTGTMSKTEIMDWAAASDLSAFPSKFEMDTFLMAMGEAMASGAVPMATAQRGMRHFGHRFDPLHGESTGLALPRSFRTDDPVLTDAVYNGMKQMLKLMRDDPKRLEPIRGRAVKLATSFTWKAVAGRFLAVFEACAAGLCPADASFGKPLFGIAPDPQLRNAGQGSTVRTNLGIEITWTEPQADTVQAILPEYPVQVYELARTVDGSFQALLPSLAARQLAILITCRDGSSIWTQIGVQPAGYSCSPEDVQQSQRGLPQFSSRKLASSDASNGTVSGELL